MAICPYISTVDAGTNYWAICNEDGTVTLNGETKECILWDSTNGYCGTFLLPTLKHIHDSHYHGLSHSCSEFPDPGCGKPSMGPNYTQVLTEELNSGEDKDGNSEAYGVDFRLSSSSCPPGIIEMNRRISYDLPEKDYNTLKDNWS